MKKKLDLLIEIDTEPFPARFVRDFVKGLEEGLKRVLNEERIDFGEVSSCGSVYRVWVYIKDVSTNTEEKIKVIKGPKFKTAFLNGNPTDALRGFLKKYNADLKDIDYEGEGEEKRVILNIKIFPRNTEEILMERTVEIFKSLSFEKMMRWPEADFPFPRPIRNILFMFGAKRVKVSFSKIESRNYCLKNDKRIKISSSSEFFKIMKNNGVILKKGERENIFLSKVNQVERRLKGNIVFDRDLLDEVLELNENPEVITGSFSEKFLQLPEEIIIEVLKEQQKFFCFKNMRGKLLPYFVACVEKGINKKKVSKNMERVVEARLEDALFFFKSDIEKNPDYFNEKLKGIVFQEKLGTLFDKKERVKKLSKFIIENFKIEVEREITMKIAEYSKFDSSTKLVYEFPELSGVAGRIYLEVWGYDERIARGVEGVKKNPSDRETVIVYIADKIDTIVGSFILGKIPKGSFDPLGLKKEADNLLESCFSIDIDLKKIIEYSFSLYKNSPLSEIYNFLISRLENILKEKGFRFDEIESVLNIKNFNPFDVLKRVEAIRKIREEEDFKELITGFKRVNNILNQAEKKGENFFDGVKEEFLEKPEEKKLYDNFLTIKDEFDDILNNRDYYKALKVILKLKKDIDEFFDKVFVMVEDEKLRKNRITLLKAIRDGFFKIADLSKIVVEGG